jgi:hypothetical protein
MIKEEKEYIIKAWSKIIIALMLTEDLGAECFWKNSILESLEKAKLYLEELIKEKKKNDA